MGTQRWFVDSGGVINGPLSSSELRALVNDGTVTAATLCKHDLMQDFVPAGRIKGLLPAPASAADAQVPAARRLPDLPQLPPPASMPVPAARPVMPAPQLPPLPTAASAPGTRRLSNPPQLAPPAAIPVPDGRPGVALPQLPPLPTAASPPGTRQLSHLPPLPQSNAAPGPGTRRLSNLPQLTPPATPGPRDAGAPAGSPGSGYQRRTAMGTARTGQDMPAAAGLVAADGGVGPTRPATRRYSQPTEQATAPAAPGGRRIGRNGILTDVAADQQHLPIEPLDAGRLWVLAVLMLALGWIGGGWCVGDRWYMPDTVAPVVVLALGGLPAITIGFLAYLRPKNLTVAHALGTAAFTAVIGIFALFLLQLFAELALHTPRFLFIIWLKIAFLVLKAIGLLYHMTTSDNAFARWIGFVFGVGVCEETCKLLPLVYLVLSKKFRAFGFHAFVALGFFSGVGFGIGEALYCYSPWTNNCAIGSNVIRWYSAVPSHGLYSAACAAFLWRLADPLQDADGFWKKAWVVVQAAGVVALVHGTYDTVCSFGVVASMIMEVISFGILIWVLGWAARDENDPMGAVRHPWVAIPGSSKPLQIGALALSLAMMVLALAWGTDALSAKKAILLARQPWLKPYIVGIDLPEKGHAADSLTPVQAHFQLDVERETVVGTFTNTSKNTLTNVVVRCGEMDEATLAQITAFLQIMREHRPADADGDTEASDPNGPSVEDLMPKRQMAFPVLRPGESVKIDGSKTCTIECGDVVIVQAEDWDPEKLRLPTGEDDNRSK